MTTGTVRSEVALAILVAAGLCAPACGGKNAPAEEPDAGFDPAQVPPTTSDALDAWIVGSPWNAWTCEPAPRAPRLNSPHATVRVCENVLLTGAVGAGDLPVGSAAVKEMYAQGAIWSYTIAVRGKSGTGADKWFWWRKVIDGSQPSVTNQGYGEGFCSGCHAGAPAMGGRDTIFTSLP